MQAAFDLGVKAQQIEFRELREYSSAARQTHPTPDHLGMRSARNGDEIYDQHKRLFTEGSAETEDGGRRKTTLKYRVSVARLLPPDGNQHFSKFRGEGR